MGQEAASLEQLYALRSHLLQQQALKNVGMIGGAGLGVGMAGRGLMGLWNMARRNLAPPEPTNTHVPPMMAVAYPDQQEGKQANQNFSITSPSTWPKAVGNVAAGRAAENPLGVPWFLPAAVGTGAAATAGGWSLMDYLLDNRRKDDLDTELDQAKNEYEAALMAQFQGKQAAAGSLSADLDRLFDKLESGMQKEANLGHYAGMGAGMYGLYAMGSGGLAATVAYQLAAKRRRADLLRRAQQKHQRALASMGPAPILARPAPMSPPSSPGAPSEDELNGQPLDKAAALSAAQRRNQLALKKRKPRYVDLSADDPMSTLGKAAAAAIS